MDKFEIYVYIAPILNLINQELQNLMPKVKVLTSLEENAKSKEIPINKKSNSK